MNALGTSGLFAQEATTEFHADNKWLPESSELLWGTVAFLIIAFVLWKYAAKPVRAALNARTERIAKEMESAASARSSAEAQAERLRAGLTNLEAERERILAEARQTAERMREEGIARNDADVRELETRADADIEASRGRAASDLEAQVATLAGEATERIVVGELDDATLQRLVEDFIATVGAG